VEPACRVSDDIYALRTYFPVPALGMLPVNAFVLQAREPVLIDTGLIAEHDEFMATLEFVMDPRDLRWLWLTHPDPDHVGSLQQLVTDNPHLRVITTFLGFGMLSLFCPFAA
jgi:flavorubredoxin